MSRSGVSIEALRTPEESFRSVRDFPYEAKYLEDVIGGLRLAYYDIPSASASASAPASPDTFLCLHGEPTWSYLYRKMIPILKQRGRVVCVDLIGFGRSDKPVRREDYSYSLHRTALLSSVQRLGLCNITLVVQDWGGLLGLTLPLEAPELYSRLLIMNTMLPLEGDSFQVAIDLKLNQNPNSGFGRWLRHSQSSDDMAIGELIQMGSNGGLSRLEIDAYDAPFPSKEYKTGALVFPTLVPLTSKMDGYQLGRDALNFWKYHWKGVAFMAVGALDVVIPPRAMARLRKHIRGCGEPMIVEEGGHFVQEQGESIAWKALAYFDQVGRGCSHNETASRSRL